MQVGSYFDTYLDEVTQGHWGHSGTQSPHAAGQVRGGGVTSALLQEDGNWGGIAHRRPVQCLLNPTPPCDLRPATCDLRPAT
jgi:hypothetical protein